MSSHASTSVKRRPKVIHASEGKRLSVQGIVFSYKVVGEDTEGPEGIVPPRHGAPEHIHHREDEAFYILEGEFETERGGEIFKAVPATFTLLPKGLPHRFQNFSNKPGKVLCLQSPSGIEEFFEHMSLLAEAGQPPAQKIKELVDKYEIEFPPPAR